MVLATAGYCQDILLSVHCRGMMMTKHGITLRLLLHTSVFQSYLLCEVAQCRKHVYAGLWADTDDVIVLFVCRIPYLLFNCRTGCF